MKRILWIGCFLAAAVCAVSAAVTVSNVSAVQRAGTKLVDIHYDVSSDVTNAVDVSVRIANGTQDVAAYAFTGDIGTGITTGTNKLIVWNAGADQDGKAASVQVNLIVDDGASLNTFIPPCPVPQTGQTNSYHSGDNGDLQSGVAWPNPRFEMVQINGDNVLVDSLTGLMWEMDFDGSVYGLVAAAWEMAVDECSGSTYAGFSDWRIPSVRECESLRDFGHDPAWDPSMFSSGGLPMMWTGTTDSFFTNFAWAYEPYMGTNFRQSKDAGFMNVIPVRTIQANAIAPAARSGQTAQYRFGDDGTYRSGGEWPNPRFIDQGDTVVDRLTGLEWLKNANAFAPAEWAGALDECSSVGAGGYGDWRLPTANELASLIDYSHFDPALPTGHPFQNVQNGIYWTSTRVVPFPSDAYAISLSKGEMIAPPIFNNTSITNHYLIWPVRGGN